MLNSLIRLLKSESKGQHSFMLHLDNEEQENILINSCLTWDYIEPYFIIMSDSRLDKLFEIEYLSELFCFGLFEGEYFYDGLTPFEVHSKYYKEYQADKHLIG